MLSCLMLDDVQHDGQGPLLGQYAPVLDPSWFHSPAHQEIMRQILRLRERGGVASLPSIWQALEYGGSPPLLMADLADIYGLAASPTIEMGYHLREMVLAHASRRLALESAANLAASDHDEIGSRIARMRALSDELTDVVARHDDQSEDQSTARALALAFVERASSWAASSGDGYGKPVGLAALERMRVRIYPGQRLIIAGESNVGKSTLAAQIILHLAQGGERVAVISLEDGRERWTDRAMAHLSQVSLSRMRDGALTKIELGRLSQATQRFAALPLVVEDYGGLTLDRFALATRRLARAGATVLLVDYLQLLRSPRATDSRQRVTDASALVQALALDLGISIIAVASLRKLNGATPTLDDLKESGDIGYDATEVMALSEIERSENPDLPTVLGCHVLKQKDGPKGTVRLALRGPLFRVEDYQQHEPDESQQPKRRKPYRDE